MPQVGPNQVAVENIVESIKPVGAEIVWKHDAEHNQNWAIFDIDVENKYGLRLRLYGKAQMVDPHKVSYSLCWTLGGKTHRIFSLDVKGSHKNKYVNRNTWHEETHKQIWKDVEPNYAYTPVETIPEDPNAAFLEFCEECNISFSGQIGAVPEK